MNEFLYHYERVPPVTWAYLSSLLMIGLFFKFSRFWSVRNLDIVLLILLAPGLLLYHYGSELKERGERWKELHPGASVGGEVPPPMSDFGTSTSVVDSPSEQGSPSSRADVEPSTSTSDLLPTPDASGDPDTTPPAIESGAEETAGAIVSDPPGTPLEEGGAVDGVAPADAADPPESAEGASEEGVLEEGVSEEGRTEADDDIERGDSAMSRGFVWLFCVGLLLLARLLVDPMMVRRPLLEPNLSTGGLAFIGCSLFVFLMANVISSVPTKDDLRGPRSAEELLSGESEKADEGARRHGPGYALLNLIPSIPTMPLLNKEKSTDESKEHAYATAAKTMATLGHLFAVIGIVAVGYWHFDNVKMGIGAATMYLLLPYAAQMTGRVSHVIPAALLVWALLFYRRPLTAGMFLGLAIGVVYYPIFLLPLWCSFYWERGLMRFASGVVAMLLVMVLLLFLVPDDLSFWHKFCDMFGLLSPAMKGLEGVWGHGWPTVYRIPVITAFVALSVILALWPAQKNLGTLMSCSGAVMVATQFWHGYGGGLYMAWYLPLLLLTIFRPNLEDRVALSVLGVGWFPRRRLSFDSVEKAAFSAHRSPVRPDLRLN